MNDNNEEKEVLEDTDKCHPSYGILSISRIHSNKGQPLVGSSIRHSTLIKVEVSRSYKDRSLHADHYHQSEHIVELYLSPTQFTDVLTNMNTSGVPCTLTCVNGENQEKYEGDHVYETFVDEFKADVQSVLGTTSRLMKKVEAKLKAPGRISRADRDSIAADLYKIEQDIRSSMPFVQKQFNRQVDRTINEAKSEIEAFQQGTILALGKKKLRKLLGKECSIKLIGEE